MIHQGDFFSCIDGNTVFDCTITDPPYDARTHAGADYHVNDRSAPISFQPLGESEVRELVHRLLERTKRWVVVFCSLEQLGLYAKHADKAWVRAGIWVKQGAAPQFTGDRPAQGCEGIAIMHRLGRKHWNGGGKVATWCAPVERSGRQHEAQKPLALMLQLVEDFTNPNELVYDPFAGFGTTGVACLLKGRRFLGLEKSQMWVNRANQRLAEVGVAGPIFKQESLL